MTTPNTGLILQLSFAEIADGKLADVSGNGHDGTPLGHPLLVPDDIFGSCLNLDGVDDYVSLPNFAADYASGLTIGAWVFYSSFKNWSRILDAGNGPSSDNFTFSNVGTSNNLSLHVFRGGDGKSVEAAGVLKTDEWMHVAAVVDAAGKATLYVNAEPVATGALQLPRTLARANNYIGRSNWAGNEYFHGKMGSLRVYNRALSVAEIKQDMADDQTASAAFRASYPLTFKLFDRDDDQQVIYITDQPDGRVMSFEVSNTSRKAVTLPKPDVAQVSAENYHFELRLRAGALSARALTKLALAEPGWTMLKPKPDQSTQNGAGISLYFLSDTARTLNPSGKITLTLSGVSADPGAGARGTRAELKFKGIYFPGDPTPLDGTRLQHLNIVSQSSQSGRQTIPLHVSFPDSNTILNDGATNKLSLRITNVSKNALALAPAPGTLPSKLVISFDTRGNDETGKNWALGTASQVNGIQVTAPGWTPFKPESISPEWILTTTKTSLAPGEAIELTLENIVSSLPSGMTNMYVRYENIPGYLSGQLVAGIEKSQIIYRGDKMGIGTADPQAKLHVVGGAIMPAHGNSETAGIMFPKDPFRGGGDAAWLRYYSRNRLDEAMTLELGILNDADDHIALMSSGNVGVGTNVPEQKLHINGGSEVLTTGPGAGYKFRDRASATTVNDWIWYAVSNSARLYRVNLGDVLVVGSSGNVGVGANAPAQKLHVNGGSEILTTGPGGGYKFRDRASETTVNDWVWYAANNSARLYRVNLGDVFAVNASGNVGVGTVNPRAKLTVNGTMSVTAIDNTPGITTRLFEGRINNGQTLDFDLYTLNASGSSHLELLVMMHDSGANTYRLLQKTEYSCYKSSIFPVQIEQLAQIYRRVNSQNMFGPAGGLPIPAPDIYRADVLANGDTIRVRISQNGNATSSFYQIVAKYMMVGM